MNDRNQKCYAVCLSCKDHYFADSQEDFEHLRCNLRPRCCNPITKRNWCPVKLWGQDNFEHLNRVYNDEMLKDNYAQIAKMECHPTEDGRCAKYLKVKIKGDAIEICRLCRESGEEFILAKLRKHDTNKILSNLDTDLSERIIAFAKDYGKEETEKLIIDAVSKGLPEETAISLLDVF